MTTQNYLHILSESDRKDIGRVGVLCGGLSDERQVSLWSGEAIFNALKTAGIDAELIDVKKDFISVVIDKPFDFAFIALHGRGGEDGTVQAILDWLEIPYVGSGVSASAIAMDKIRSKQLWQSAGLPVLPQIVLEDNYDLDEIIEYIGLPLVVKPALEGSSNGISKVETKEQLSLAYKEAAKYDSVIMAERWADGEEYTGVIIGENVLPLIRIDVTSDIYDYETKYITGANGYFCPCGLSDEKEKELQALMLGAAKTIGTKDWSRVDIILDDNNQPWLIEINTIPGMTETSLVPKAAKAAGMDFIETVLVILKTSLGVHYA